ncbi:pilus assembly protein PilP [Massilia forsythiae]|uniref:Pilus assembly protein PilP n=1 Tax=Massilia forsythiae TaxID=2728020 RepID=A0A7Z2ZRP2_9BURK|nr:pilus assembly protein PilP [Massilia forsythiae]QJD99652.1 pilus assembly protein PilP [Massilia forsythiae]
MMRAHTMGAAALAALLLVGCGDSDVQEVREWMTQVQRDTHPKVKPLPEPKDFIPYAYGAKEAVDPFSQNKLLGELAKAAAASTNPNQPDTRRPRELLETFPLDTMRMVGTMQKGGAGYALVQIDRALYQVRAGQRIGQNFGVVTRVTDDAVNIREVVQDAAGEWTERMAKLELQSKETGQ